MNPSPPPTASSGGSGLPLKLQASPKPTLSVFTGIQRGIQLVFACYAAWLALGGEVGRQEAGLLLACVGMNELRLRMKFERSQALMTVFWTGVFGAAPVLYLLLRLEGESGDMAALVSGKLALAPLVVALALPFQVFAAYLPRYPKAQHLIYCFALVEAVLAVRHDGLQPISLYLLIFVLLLALCIWSSHAGSQHHPATSGKRQTSGPARNARASRNFASLRTLDTLLRPSLLLMLLPLLLSLLVVAGAIFVVVPRYSVAHPTRAQERPLRTDRRGGENVSRPDQNFPLPGMASETGDGMSQGISGLASEVSLGQFGPLLKDHRPYATLQASLPEDQPLLPSFLHRLLLKASTLDTFDGSVWSTRPASGSDLHTLEIGESLNPHRQGPLPQETLAITFKLQWADPQSLQEAFLLVAPYACERVDIGRDADQHELSDLMINYDTVRDRIEIRSGDVLDTEEPRSVSSVEFRSLVAGPIPLSTAPVAYSGLVDAARWLAVPKVVNDALLREWKERPQFAGLQRSPHELALAVEDWFRKSGGYGYSLDARPVGPRAILDFIIDPKARNAHCEYFASAMAVILRHFGVPTRLCLGYAPNLDSSLEADGPQWKVLHSDAHAWIEAWLPGIGWTSFDPTTQLRMMAAEPSLPEQPTQMDAGDSDLIAHFDHQSRERVLAAVEDGVMVMLAWVGAACDFPFALLPASWRPEAAWLRMAMTVALLSGIAIAVAMYMRTRRLIRRRVRSGLGTAGVRHGNSALYRELLEVLAQRGFQRKPSQTPMEFARFVVHKGGNTYASVMHATEAFYRLRYQMAKSARGTADAKHTQELREYRRWLKRLAAETTPKSVTTS